jgi:hypothetical protein
LLGRNYLEGYDRTGLPTTGLPGTDKSGYLDLIGLGLLGFASTAEAVFFLESRGLIYLDDKSGLP